MSFARVHNVVVFCLFCCVVSPVKRRFSLPIVKFNRQYLLGPVVRQLGHWHTTLANVTLVGHNYASKAKYTHVVRN